jgi:hypothetical protein
VNEVLVYAKILTMRTMAAFTFLISTCTYSFSCYDPQEIHQKPIQFDEQRIALTREYQRTHYGIQSESIEIEPKMIILHWTVLPSFELTYKIFNSPTLPENSPRRGELPGDLNVSIHFVVEKGLRVLLLSHKQRERLHEVGLKQLCLGYFYSV